MKVMLIVPPITLKERYGDLEDVGTSYPSLGLACIAAVCEKRGDDVIVIDAEVTGESMDHIKETIKEEKPDIIGMQVYITNISQSFKVAEIAKDVHPTVKIIFGGAQATLEPRIPLQSEYVDFVAMGEGEKIITGLLNNLEKKHTDYSDIKGLGWKKEKEIVLNPPVEIVKNLDEFPMPARHFFPMSRYKSSSQLRGKKTLNVMTSRGCPFRCAYCSGHLVFGRTFRFHSPKRVIAEMNHLKETYGIDSIQFYDETFTVDRNRVIELCRLIRKEHFNIPWTCFTRVNLVNEELLNEMAKAGCYQIFYGIESGNQRLLDIIRKDITIEQIKNAVHLTKKAGIEAFASFMLALPTETKEESEKTIKFAKDLDVDYAQFTLTAPFPGTHLYTLAQNNGKIRTTDISKYTGWNVVYTPNERTEEELKKTYKKAYCSFYLRPKYLLKRMAGLRKLPLQKQLELIRAGLKMFF